MLYDHLSGGLRLFANCPALVCGSTILTYSQLLRQANDLAARYQSPAATDIIVRAVDPIIFLPLALAIDALGGTLHIPPVDWDEHRIQALAHETSAVILDQGASAASGKPLPGETLPFVTSRGGKVVLFTSGTTGEPQPITHTWESLAAGIKQSPSHRGSKWLLTYPFSGFAGLQVFLQAFLNGGCLVIPRSRQMPDIFQAIEQEKVENVSGTPTFWRAFLSSAPSGTLPRLPLQQITLGGEIASQPVLSALRKAFPGARITHIYASTELGVCFSVHDGLAGFPASYLDERTSGVGLKIDHGELLVQTPSADHDHSWRRSGDLVELRGERVFFLGRKSEVINVGGSKVYPVEVEEEIMKIPGVLKVRVIGQPSSIAGELVRAEVLPRPGLDLADLKSSIINHCAKALPSFKRPRLIEFVDQVPENQARKLVRTQAA